MISLSVPAILGMVVVGLYSFMDAIFVGKIIGSTAMTAVSLAYPYTFFNNGITALFGIGSASVLSRAIGKKDQATIDKIMGNMIALLLIFSLLTMILVPLFARELLMLAGAKGDILTDAVKYLRVLFLGSFFINFAQAGNMIMRSEGAFKHAMILMGIGAVINIILDPIMIIILKEYGLGMEGSAIATVIAQSIQAFITLQYFRKKSKIVRIDKIKIEKSLISPIISIGFSAMIMQIMTMVMQIVMFNTASKYGDTDWQTFLSASLRIETFAFIPLWGIAQGFQPAVGTNFGAKEYGRVREITKIFLIAGTVLALAFYIPIELFPKTLLSLFIQEKEIVTLGITNFRIMFSAFFLYGFMVLSITLFQAVGKAVFSGAIAICRQVLLFIPLVLILPRIGNLGIRGVFMAPPITDVVLFVFCFIMVMYLLKNLGKGELEKNIKGA